MEYIYGSDTGKEGFNKANRNFSLVDSTITSSASTTLQSAKDWATGTFSNPNLLINGDFQVWQRGESFSTLAKTNSKYTLDRVYSWSENDECTIKKVANGIQAVGRITFLYRFEDAEYKKIAGKVVTFSRCKNGVINISTFTMPMVQSASTISWTNAVGETSIYNWWKLELGSVATPFVSRSYGEELALCQRCFQIIKAGQRIICGFLLGNSLDFYYPIQEMRTIPAFALNGTQGVDYAVRTLNGAVQTGFTFSATVMTKTQLGLKATKTAHGLADGQFAVLGTNGEIWLDAEIY